ncbi:MAG TPA: glutamine--fructose-6-phosphate transaminase (isomerizing) [Candidatus Sulfotelmatobacter sp.]|nr:glutamine--fructose-6-phosphate transaminase (isomerizing) [Candidatus Sulfotelmatobacter sp.]
MCGIIGIIGKTDVAPRLIDGLRRLEYRGYDSAGIATVTADGFDRRRAEGKLANLAAVLARDPLPGTTGIGHTRWATHGQPNERNAHPHMSGRVAVVHNGIIENFAELKTELTARGHAFESDTDTEAVVHLITDYLGQGLTPEQAFARALPRLHGAFALAAIFAGEPDLMIGARRGPPLAIGYGDGEMFLGSDALALAPLTRRISYLEDGDWAVVTTRATRVFDADNRPVERAVKRTEQSGAFTGKGNFRHFMEKEIFEQPAVIGDTLRSMFNPAERTITLADLPFDLASLSRLTIAACGTAFHSGLVARYWMERLARLPVDVDVASEFRYRNMGLPKDGLALFISQSGETADTIAALRYAKQQGSRTAVLVNTPDSSMAREADVVLTTLAGPEIAVASTKAFTTQLTVLACLTIALGRARGTLDHAAEARLSRALAEVPALVAEVLGHDEAIRALALQMVKARDVLFLGRGTSYPIALEGALKLKELSYIHAEGYAAGEMKHGPIALIDDGVPVIVAAPSDELFDKTASNIEEVAARRGRIILLSDAQGCARFRGRIEACIEMPTVDPFVAPILYTVPTQLLAYHVAVAKGTDVDQPRNLAKSVTVE